VKFLIDNNISRRICPHIEAAGHEAVHVEALSMADADDDEILERARESGAVVVSSDTDFGVLLAFQRATSPSVILTREVSTLRPAGLADLIVANLPSFADALEKGDRRDRTGRDPCPPASTALIRTHTLHSR
jgi:predicted nuclease of predicted toxin-antitoxin system